MSEGAPRPVADWIAADWGTTSLRLWAMGADGAARARAEAPAGMATLSRGDYAPTLLRFAGAWLGGSRRTPAVVCGMAGAREGWAEAGYADIGGAPPAPVAPDLAGAQALLDLRILPGLRQVAPPDVMRGEETQLAGLVAERPDFAGVAVLPGTHSKWARIGPRGVEGFRSFMTGELFALLAERSTLRGALSGGWDEAAFREAAREAITAPERLPASLFPIRAASLLRGPEAGAKARLSGLLIGAEIAAARALGLCEGPLVVIGGAALAGRYAAALEAAGLEGRVLDGERMTLAGLVSAYRRIFEGAGA